MASSKVFFMDLRASLKENLVSKLIRLADTGGIGQIVPPRGLVAIKLHFGEKGNTAFIRPIFIRQIVDKVRSVGGLPFLTDTNTLYAGTRGNSISHLETAIANGFAYSVVNAPIIIADGIRGASRSKISVNGEIIKIAYLAKDIVDANALISVAHFKGHELAGFGGSIKNLGMGCASRKGKLEQHSGLCPKVKSKNCIGCGECVEHCAQNAITLVDEKAVIDPQKCVGCGECIQICPNRAINVQWSSDIPIFQKKMTEYALAALNGKEAKSLFINFLTNISPACDCLEYNDAPIVHDIGIMVSKDPVAIDQASVDIVNSQTGIASSCLSKGVEKGGDKFGSVYPYIDWSVQLEHGEKIGLGSREYELLKLED